MWSTFKSILDEGINRYIPMTVGSSWKQKSCWSRPISKEFKKLIKRKHRLWTRFVETKDRQTEKEFKRIRNVVRKQSRNSARNENVTIAKACKENPKAFWKHIKSKSNTFTGIGNIKILDGNGDSKVVSDDIEKSNAFIDYFAKIYTEEPLEAFDTLTERIVSTKMTIL